MSFYFGEAAPLPEQVTGELSACVTDAEEREEWQRQHQLLVKPSFSQHLSGHPPQKHQWQQRCREEIKDASLPTDLRAAHRCERAGVMELLREKESHSELLLMSNHDGWRGEELHTFTAQLFV